MIKFNIQIDEGTMRLVSFRIVESAQEMAGLFGTLGGGQGYMDIYKL